MTQIRVQQNVETIMKINDIRTTRKLANYNATQFVETIAFY